MTHDFSYLASPTDPLEVRDSLVNFLPYEFKPSTKARLMPTLQRHLSPVVWLQLLLLLFR